MLAGEGDAELVSAVAWRVAAGVGIAPRRATVVVGGLRRGEGYQGSESKLQEERGGVSEIQSSPGGPNMSSLTTGTLPCGASGHSSPRPYLHWIFWDMLSAHTAVIQNPAELKSTGKTAAFPRFS
jgi:hypothetical protein